MTEGTIPDGMVPWGGSDSAPADWDGGSWMMRDGTIYKRPPVRWYWHRDARFGEWDTIAYTPRAAAARQPEQCDTLATNEGMVLVPRVATETMLQAGAGQLFGSASDDWREDARDVWNAMIAAALAPASGETE